VNDDLRERIAELSPAKRALLERRLRQQKSPLPETAIQPGQPGDPRPLSFAQESLWLQEQIDPGSPAYNCPFAFEMHGDLSPAVLEQALTALVERHETVRTRYVRQESGAPAAVLDPSRSVPLPLVHSTAENLLPLLRAESRRPFDLSRDCMLRALLIRLAADSHVLLVVMHHIACDAWSSTVVVPELAEFYRALRTGETPALAPLPIQYADYARWQREYMQGEVLASKLAHWKQQLADYPKVLDLCFGRTRPSVLGHHGAQVKRKMPAELQEAVERFSQQNQCTLFVTLLAAFSALLHRYSGQEQLLVGTPSASRDRAELSALIGCFVNSLLVAGDFSGDPTFLDFLGQIKARVRDVYGHGDLPFEKLVQELQPQRDRSSTPLFQVTFNFVNLRAMSAPSGGPDALAESWDSNLRVQRVEFDPEISIFDLALQVRVEESGVFCTFLYNTALFEPSFIAAMAENYETLLAGIVADPAESGGGPRLDGAAESGGGPRLDGADRRVSQLPLLATRERDLVLAKWNQTHRDYPLTRCLHELFEDQVAKTPDAEALVFENQRLTYRDLNARANQLAHHLRARGMGPDVLVGLCVERSVEMVVAILGILKAGGAYVPLDPEYPKDRLQSMLEDAQSPIILTQRRLRDVLPESGASVFCLDTEWAALAGESVDNPVNSSGPENICYVIFTSGTTGRPKGVMNVHKGVVNLLQWMQDEYRLTVQDRVIQTASYSFDFSVEEFFWPLIVGASVVLVRPGGHREPGYLIDLIRRERITTMDFVPSMLQVFLDEPDVERCDSLKRAFSGGEALPAGVPARFFAKLDAALYNVYGPTETTVHSTHWDCRRDSRSPVVPIGRPIANDQVYILDQWMQPVPVGVAGELHIGGVGLARGYLRRPEITAEKFVPDPFSEDPQARLYKSGDLGRWLSDGTIEYLGRLDHQVKIRGYRIELGEIESVMRQDPAVQDALVTVHDYGRDDRRLVGYIVPGMDDSSLVENLKLRLKSALPEYMVPSAFVLLPEFPTLPNGKTDRKSLPPPETDPAGRGTAAATSVAPRNAAEQKMAEIWQELLHGPLPSVRDNFFEIGGNSLLAVVLTTRIQRVFGKKLPLTVLIQDATIEKLVETLGQDSSLACSSLIEMQGGPGSPFFCVPGWGGRVLILRALALCFRGKMPFYAFEGKEPHEINAGSIPELAAAYIAEMKQRQPAGPYNLGGFCWGARLAWEMAQQLHAAGDEVALLALLDPPILDPAGAEWAFRNGVRYRLRQIPSQPFREAAATFYGVFRDIERSVRARFGLIHHPPDLLTEAERVALHGTPESQAFQTEIARKYKPVPYPGALTIFFAEHNKLFANEARRRDWQSLAQGEYREVTVEGGHLTWLEPPAVERLAAALLDALATVRSAESGGALRLDGGAESGGVLRLDGGGTA
jgi:amino acid adenylation domain-containing protein